MGDYGIVEQPWETTLRGIRRLLDGAVAVVVEDDGGGGDWKTACRIVIIEDYNPL